jgi:hypothetical protein
VRETCTKIPWALITGSTRVGGVGGADIGTVVSRARVEGGGASPAKDMMKHNIHS